MQTLWQDFRYSLRMLAKNPGFSATAILTLALGVGANTAIFSVVNAVLLRPLPFEEPDRLVQIWHTPPQASFPGIPTFSVSPANFLDWRSRSHAFEGMSAYGFGRYTLTGTGHPEAVRMVAATSGFFSILRAKPLLGRTFLEEEDSPGRDHEVILSYNLWRSRFGADRNVVGKNIALNEQAFTVVGVMGPNFEFPISTDPDARPQMWKPLGWTDQERGVRDNHNYGVLARLKSGATLQQSRAELDSISNQLALQYPSDNKGWGATPVPLREDLVGDVRPALLILLDAVTPERDRYPRRNGRQPLPSFTAGTLGDRVVGAVWGRARLDLCALRRGLDCEIFGAEAAALPRNRVGRVGLNICVGRFAAVWNRCWTVVDVAFGESRCQRVAEARSRPDLFGIRRGSNAQHTCRIRSGAFADAFSWRGFADSQSLDAASRKSWFLSGSPADLGGFNSVEQIFRA